jgi:hypothetical protein
VAGAGIWNGFRHIGQRNCLPAALSGSWIFFPQAALGHLIIEIPGFLAADATFGAAGTGATLLMSDLHCSQNNAPSSFAKLQNGHFTMLHSRLKSAFGSDATRSFCNGSA